MKTYVVHCVKGFDCVVEGKQYHCVRAMVGIIEKVNNVPKCVGIKLIKCANDFTAEIGKFCNIFFDENGKAVSIKYL